MLKYNKGGKDMRILIAEDELSLARALVKILEKNNYSADAVHNGDDAVVYMESGNYDAAIFDIMMPKTDGITAMKRLRESGCNIPILLLTAKSSVDDMVDGLDSGANYYLTKPFDTKALLAAIRVITRSENEVSLKLSYGNIVLDRSSYVLSSPAGTMHLTAKEFQILELLMSNPKRVISSEKFMERIWGFDSDAEINVVWVYISYLRKKLRQLGSNVTIKASRNLGYFLEINDD